MSQGYEEYKTIKALVESVVDHDRLLVEDLPSKEVVLCTIHRATGHISRNLIDLVYERAIRRARFLSENCELNGDVRVCSPRRSGVSLDGSKASSNARHYPSPVRVVLGLQTPATSKDLSLRSKPHEIHESVTVELPSNSARNLGACSGGKQDNSYQISAQCKNHHESAILVKGDLCTTPHDRNKAPHKQKYNTQEPVQPSRKSDSEFSQHTVNYRSSKSNGIQDTSVYRANEDTEQRYFTDCLVMQKDDSSLLPMQCDTPYSSASLYPKASPPGQRGWQKDGPHFSNTRQHHSGVDGSSLREPMQCDTPSSPAHSSRESIYAETQFSPVVGQDESRVQIEHRQEEIAQQMQQEPMQCDTPFSAGYSSSESIFAETQSTPFVEQVEYDVCIEHHQEYSSQITQQEPMQCDTPSTRMACYARKKTPEEPEYTPQGSTQNGVMAGESTILASRRASSPMQSLDDKSTGDSDTRSLGSSPVMERQDTSGNGNSNSVDAGHMAVENLARKLQFATPFKNKKSFSMDIESEIESVSSFSNSPLQALEPLEMNSSLTNWLRRVYGTRTGGLLHGASSNIDTKASVAVMLANISREAGQSETEDDNLRDELSSLEVVGLRMQQKRQVRGNILLLTTPQRLQSWYTSLKEKTTLGVVKFHGVEKRRFQSASWFQTYGFVVASYGALTTEDCVVPSNPKDTGDKENLENSLVGASSNAFWQPKKKGNQSARRSKLHQVHWKQILVDTAEVLIKPQTKRARALGSLQCDFRWALLDERIRALERKHIRSIKKFIGGPCFESINVG